MSNESEVELSAEDHLAELERQAVAGEAVSTADLVEARERVSLAALVRQGIASRADVKRQAAAVAKAAAAKAEATKLFAGHDGDSAAAYDAAVAGMENYLAVIEADDARISEGARILIAGGVVPSNWNRTHGEGFDPENFAQVEPGATTSSVRVDGTSHVRVSAPLLIAAAVEAVASAHGGLPLPQGRGTLESKVRFR